MRLSRFVLACAVLLVVSLAWNGLLHLVLLRGVEAAARALYRTDLADRLWLSLAGAAAVVVLFVAGYRRFARVGSAREAAGYGLSFALVAGALVDLNQYVLFPIPGRLACLWFLGGLVEFTAYGLIVRAVVPPLSRAAAASPVGRGA